jgi:hypothetical protein
MALLDETADDALAKKRKKRLEQAGLNINTEGPISIMRKSMRPTISDMAPDAPGGGYGPSLINKATVGPSWGRASRLADEERKRRLRGG